MASPRERMVRSAAVLIRERGAHPTAIADVLAHSGAPRGSAYHYFPGGRTQLLCEAIDYASDHVAGRLDRAADTAELLDDMITKFRDQLLDSDFRAGCPVVAVAVEAGTPSAPTPPTPCATARVRRFTAGPVRSPRVYTPTVCPPNRPRNSRP